MLTPEEKAILHHVVLKSPALNRNLGEYFHYAGDTIYFLYKRKGEKLRDSIIDYDSIEQVVIYEPSLLEVNFNELKKSSQGLLSEVATKMALQTTYRELKRRDEIKTEGISDSVYVNFLRELSNNLPDKAVRIKNSKRIPISEIMDVLDPNIIFNNRVKELNKLKSFKLVEQQEIVNVISESIRSFIQNKSYEYFLKIGGKRLRPVLTLLGADLFGGDIQKALKPAMGIELFHNFTLVHDDIMDDAPLRRGQSTVHEKWNLNTAILSGDVLFVDAFEKVSDVDQPFLKEVLKVFVQTAREVCEGQQKDMDFESELDVTEEEYIHMIQFKTSVLSGCALQIGAIISGAAKSDAEHLYQFGLSLGTSFQIQDLNQ